MLVALRQNNYYKVVSRLKFVLYRRTFFKGVFMLEQFKEYISRFPESEAIQYKYEHSIRVMELSYQLGKSLNINDIELVKIIGLLHDFARFKQWNEYQTFDDLITFDHGDEAIKLLFDYNEIEKYNIDKNKYYIIKDAIKCHNKYQIQNINKNSLIFCQIIRDADKIDIISNFTKALFNKNNTNFIHKEVKKQFFNHKEVKKIENMTNYDKLITMLALIYGLNFNYSFEYLKENQIINTIKKQVDKEIFNPYFEEIENYIERGKKYVR